MNLRRFLPAWLRRLLRRGLDLLLKGRHSPLRQPVAAVRFRWYLFFLRRALTRLERAAARDQVDLALMRDVAQAWGNPNFVADAGFLLEVVRTIRAGKGPILDCGSGLSTVVAAVIAAPQGDTVWSLEQDEEWYHHVQRVLAPLSLGNVVLWYAPIRSYGSFVWYDLKGRRFPKHFATVSCDGPAVHRTAWPAPLHQGWRVGVVLVLRDLGISFDRIVLDDATDSRAAGLLERWEAEGIATRSVDAPTGRHIIGIRTARPS